MFFCAQKRNKSLEKGKCEMMKLKYLFDNRDLAKMLVGNWNYDESSLEMFQYYRISSNAIYPFQNEGKTKLLRFAPASEKCKDSILAELEFINYLRGNQYPALKIVLSNNSKELVTANTPWGAYYATVFDRVSGVPMGETNMDNRIMFEYGKALGKLHKLSSDFTPKNKRWSYEDVLSWIKNILEKFQNQELALEEVSLLQECFSKLPKSNENFGLVHYDFELDNVFYDEKTHTCNVIDFDDAMYQWYIADIEQALDSIKDEIEETRYECAKDSFINGYRSQYAVTDEMLSLQPIFRRFANLYGYTRILRSVEEKWENEPEWLVKLRVKLDNSTKRRSAYFPCKL